MNLLGENVKGWMERYKLNSVKPATYDRLETSLKALLNYKIAYMDVGEIRTEDLQEFVNSMSLTAMLSAVSRNSFIL